MVSLPLQLGTNDAYKPALQGLLKTIGAAPPDGKRVRAAIYGPHKHPKSPV